jgi:hypothetical protein
MENGCSLLCCWTTTLTNCFRLTLLVSSCYCIQGSNGLCWSTVQNILDLERRCCMPAHRLQCHLAKRTTVMRVRLVARCKLCSSFPYPNKMALMYSDKMALMSRRLTFFLNSQFICNLWPPLWSSGQSSWLQIRRPVFHSRHSQKKKSSGSGTGSTQPREYNWGATW